MRGNITFWKTEHVGDLNFGPVNCLSRDTSSLCLQLDVTTTACIYSDMTVGMTIVHINTS